jgi:hypothetical protein
LSFVADGSEDAPGLPAAPLEDVSLDEELDALDGLVPDDPALDGLVVVPAVDGLVVPAADGLLDELELLLDGLVVVPAVDGLVEEPELVDGLVVELVEELVLLEGLVVEPAVDPGVPGLAVESAVDPGLLTSLLRVSSRPASQPASARTMADAMMLFVQIVMIVFLCLKFPERADAPGGRVSANTMPVRGRARSSDDRTVWLEPSPIGDSRNEVVFTAQM